MIFLNNLYTVWSECSDGSGHEYVIRLNPDHFIYSAHFPGEPITPGVCILQIAAELLSKCIGRELRVTCIKNVKFIQILVPDKGQDVSVRIGKVEMVEDTVKSQIAVSVAESIIAKISIVCQIVG